MKKLTRKYKKWLIIRARHEAKKPKRVRNRVRVSHLVRAWYGEEVEEVISNQLPTKPPKRISLKENPDETMEYLDSSRNRFCSLRQSEAGKKYNWIVKSKSGKGKRRISSYVDFSDISLYGTAPALILTAEYDRLRTLMDDVPPTINLDEWQEPVFRRLYEMGFFEVVGITDSVSDRYSTAGDVRTMKIVTGTNSTELAAASESILELCHFLGEEQPIHDDIELALNNALSEAMINVSRHAYPSDHEFRYRHIGKWWVTASVDRLSRELTVVIYDQGASIPLTYARKEWSQAARDLFSGVLSMRPSFEFQNDGTYIEGAMMPGRTQTGRAHQGLGLPEMKDLVDICGSGSLRIFSRGGECYYECGESIQRRSRNLSIGGTLIEWTLYLPGSHSHA